MADRWRPGKVLVREALLLQRRVADAIAGSEPPVRGGRPGGTLSSSARSKALLVEKPWGAVVRWSALGQKFLWWVRGTRRQKARPVDLVPPAARVRSAVEEDAARHFAARERKASRGLR